MKQSETTKEDTETTKDTKTTTTNTTEMTRPQETEEESQDMKAFIAKYIWDKDNESEAPVQTSTKTDNERNRREVPLLSPLRLPESSIWTTEQCNRTESPPPQWYQQTFFPETSNIPVIGGHCSTKDQNDDDTTPVDEKRSRPKKKTTPPTAEARMEEKVTKDLRKAWEAAINQELDIIDRKSLKCQPQKQSV